MRPAVGCILLCIPLFRVPAFGLLVTISRMKFEEEERERERHPPANLRLSRMLRCQQSTGTGQREQESFHRDGAEFPTGSHISFKNGSPGITPPTPPTPAAPSTGMERPRPRGPYRAPNRRKLGFDEDCLPRRHFMAVIVPGVDGVVLLTPQIP